MKEEANIQNQVPNPPINQNVEPVLNKPQTKTKRLPIFIGCLILVLILSLFAISLVNYFNIFSLSQKYPDIFYLFPHQPFPDQRKINSDALYNNFKEGENWAVLAEFFKVENNIVYIKYDDKIPSLLLTKDIVCKKGDKKIPTKTGFQITSVGIPCSDIITNKNKGKKVIVDYNLDDNGNFIIKRLELE